MQFAKSVQKFSMQQLRFTATMQPHIAARALQAAAHGSHVCDTVAYHTRPQQPHLMQDWLLLTVKAGLGPAPVQVAEQWHCAQHTERPKLKRQLCATQKIPFPISTERAPNHHHKEHQTTTTKSTKPPPQLVSHCILTINMSTFPLLAVRGGADSQPQRAAAPFCARSCLLKRALMPALLPACHSCCPGSRAHTTWTSAPARLAAAGPAWHDLTGTAAAPAPKCEISDKQSRGVDRASK